MRVALSLCLLYLLLHSTASARDMAITVDDLPWVEFALSSQEEIQARHRRLLAALSGTQATGFVNEGKLVEGQRLALWRQGMLEDWLGAGFELGNHTYDHNDLHGVSVEQFESSILRGEGLLRPLLARNDMSLRWFRHPYLHTGRDAQTRARVSAFLQAHDYQIAPVTIDNGEWIYARAYVLALNDRDSELQAKLRAEYVDYMLRKVVFFESAAEQLFGREINQILLIHANALNADSLGDLLTVLRIRGYKFISLEDAVRDPAYGHADEFFGAGGISWLHRWALTDKQPSSYYQGEPEVSAWVLELAGVESE